MQTFCLYTNAKRYEDEDDCLTAAAADFVSQWPLLKGLDLDPRWLDDERDTIVLTIPAWFVMLYEPFEVI